jgi:hypothetical protein
VQGADNIRSVAIGHNNEGLTRGIPIPIDFAYVDRDLENDGREQGYLYVNKIAISSYDNDPADVRIQGGYPFCAPWSAVDVCPTVTDKGATGPNGKGGVVGKIHFDALTDCDLSNGICIDGVFREGVNLGARVSTDRSSGASISTPTVASSIWHPMDFEIGNYPESWSDDIVHRFRVTHEGNVQLGGGGYGTASRLPYYAWGTLTVVGGGLGLTAVVEPASPSCSNVGGGSGTNYWYRVIPIAANGLRGPASSLIGPCNNSGTLSSSVYNLLQWTHSAGAEFYIIVRSTSGDPGITGGAMISTTPGNACTTASNKATCQMGYGYIQGMSTAQSWAIRGDGGTRVFHDLGTSSFGTDPVRGGYSYGTHTYVAHIQSGDVVNMTGDVIFSEGSGITTVPLGATTRDTDYTQRLRIYAGEMRPAVDGGYNLGSPSYEFGTVYSVSASLGDLFFDNDFAMTEHHYLGANMPPGLGMVDVRDPNNPKLTAFFANDGTVYVNDIKALSELSIDMNRFKARLKEVNFKNKGEMFKFKH